MASGLLSIAIIFFSARGFFLGFGGVLAKFLGLILGYLMAFNYRYTLAESINNNFTIDAPPMVIMVASSAILFFGTLFTVGFVINSFFVLMVKVIPALDFLLSPKEIGNRILGAVINGFIGAAIVLLALWGYALVIDSKQPPDDLQKFANRFGDSVLNIVSNIFNYNENGEITSAVPSLSFDWNSLTSGDASNVDLKQLLENQQLQDLLNNNEIRDLLLEQMEQNPDKVMEMLNNSELAELMNQVEQQP